MKAKGFVMWSLAGALAAGIVGCGDQAGSTVQSAPAQAATPKGYKTYGGKMESTPVVAAEQVFAKPDEYNGKTIRLSGTATSVCEHRGCWLAVEKNGRTIRARFVESGDCTEGFFVPRDAAGHKVILQGTFKKEVISEAKARHFLEDANAPKEQIEKIVGPQEVLSIICTSVAIEGGDKLSEPLKAGQS